MLRVVETLLPLYKGLAELSTLQGHHQDGRQPGNFSPNGRYLAWDTREGTIYVADLPALRAEIDKFEQKLNAK